MVKKIVIKLIIVSNLIILTSCLNRPVDHGYIFDKNNLSALNKKVTTKREVLYIFGSPSIKSIYNNDNSWIYISQKVNHLLFLKPQVTSREILVIEFDDKNIVDNYYRYSLDDENKINFYPKYTSVEGHEAPGLIMDIFSNIGQVKPQ